MKKYFNYTLSLVFFMFAIFAGAFFQSTNRAEAACSGFLVTTKNVNVSVDPVGAATVEVEKGSEVCIGITSSGVTKKIIAKNVKEGFQFLGWYKDGSLVSTDLEYSILVKKSGTYDYVAKFEEMLGYDVTFIKNDLVTTVMDVRNFNVGTSINLNDYLIVKKYAQLSHYLVNGEVHNESTYIMPEHPVSIEAICTAPLLYSSKGNTYEDFESAFASGETSFFLLKNATITGTITIPSGITVVLPYKDGGTSKTEKGTVATGTNRVSWSSAELIHKYLNVVLTIEEGARINVYGNLTIGGVQHYPDQSIQAHTSGAYSQIINNGTIELYDTGTFETYGLLSGTGTIIANSGTKITEPFIINDFAGGSNASAYYNEGRLPFSQFATVNITCNQVIYYGATIVGVSSIYASLLGYSSINDSSANVIGPTGTNAVVIMAEGSRIEVSYEHKVITTPLGSTSIEDSGVTTLTMYGSISLGEFKIESYGTKDKFFNMSYTYNFVLKDGAILTLPSQYKYKIMPGASVIVEEGATVNVDGALVVYDGMYQPSKSGKYYPTPDMLAKDGFSKSGNLIVDGTLNINGTFVGTVQTNGKGVINVASNATLSLSVSEGSIDGYETAVDNLTTINMVARVNGLSGFMNLEAGKSYKGFKHVNDDTFIVPSFTYHRNQDNKDYTVTINQTMKGRFLEWNGEKYVATVKHYIGSSVDSAVSISFAAGVYPTDLNGYVTVTHTFSTGENLYYYTLNKENGTSTQHSFVIDSYTNYILLDEVIKNFTVNENSYVLAESEWPVSISGTVNFYGNKSYGITYAQPELSGDKYVYNVALEHANYSNIGINVTITIIPTEFDEYNNAVDGLVDSNDVLNEAIALYDQYKEYMANAILMDSEDYLFATNYLVKSYASNIVKELSLASVEYGVYETDAVAVLLDDDKDNITVKVTTTGYGSDLSVTFAATFTYGNVTYTLNVVPSVVTAKSISVTIDDQSVIYGDEDVELTMSLDDGYSLVGDDVLNDVISLSRISGVNAGVYDIKGTTIHNGYNVTYSYVGKYTINTLGVSYSVNEHDNVRLKYKNNVAFSITEINGNDLSGLITYEIRNSDEVVATVKNGKLTVVGDYGVGEYSVYAILESNNHHLVNGVPATLKVVKDEEYYVVSASFDKSSFVYDGVEKKVTISVVVAQSGEVVTDYTYTINNDSKLKVINVGTYLVDIDVDGAVYNDVTSVEVTPKTLSVSYDKTTFVYNGSVQHPVISLSTGIVDNDDVVLVTNTFTSVNKGDYSATLSLSGKDAYNYTLEVASVDYVINALSVSYKVKDHRDVMVSNKETVSSFVIEEESGLDLHPYAYYVIKSGDEEVARVVDGKLEITGNFVVGVYEVYAVVESSNYYVEESLPGVLEIVEDNLYYTVVIDVIKDSFEYDGLAATISINVSVSETGEKVTNFTYTINGKTDLSIVEAGTYKIEVNVDDVFYDRTITISPRTINVTVDDKAIIYGDEEVELTMSLDEGYSLVGNDTLSDVITLSRESGNDAGTYDIEAVANHSCYNVVFTSIGKYVINPKVVSYSVNEHTDVRLKYKNELSFSISEANGLDLSDLITYEIRNNNDVVATVKNDKLTVVGNYTVGTYTVYAVLESNNYDVVNSIPTTLKVVTDEEYYVVSASFDKASFVYDGIEKNVSISVVVAQSGEEVTDYVYTINDEVNLKVINVGTYLVDIDVDGAIYNAVASVEVTPKTLSVNYDKNSFTYNGSVQHPVISLSTGVVGNDEVELSNINYTSKDVNGYAVSLSLSGEDAYNYVLDTTLVSYVIKPMNITVSIDKVTSIYGNALSKLTFTCNDVIPSSDKLESFVTLTKEDGVVVGTYDIVGSYESDNYSVTFINGEDAYEITPRTITVAINNVSVEFGDAEQDLAYSLSQGTLVYQDKLEDIVSVSRNVGIEVGSYDIIASSKSSNYIVNQTKSTYTITPRNIELLVNDASSVYGEAYSPLTVSIKSGSMAYGEDVYGLVELSCEYQSNVGEYAIVARDVSNGNYNVTITYTRVLNSVYTVTPREVTIKINDIETEYDITYDELVSLLSYEIVSGTIVNDDFDVELQIELQNGIILTKENFVSSFGGGLHTIFTNVSHSNYDLTLISGTLSVTKCYVSIQGIETKYIYQDGAPIEVFNWKENIVGYNASASDNSFTYFISKKGIDDEYVMVDSITTVGEYRLTVMIVHGHAYEFVADTQTSYDIVVAKKDITSSLTFYNIPSDGRVEYSKLGFVPGVEMASEYLYVNYYEYITLNGYFVDEIKEVGAYTYGVVIEDDNYTGGKVFVIEVYKKDVSSSIDINIESDDILISPSVEDIEAMVKGLNSSITFEYVYLGETEEVVTDLSRPGNYRVDITVSDSNYSGSTSVTFKVLASIENEMSRLEEITVDFDIETDGNDKLALIKEIKSILRDFDDDAWYQVESNEEYAQIIEECTVLYEDFKVTVSVRVSEVKSVSRVDDVATIAAGASVLSVLLKKKKWRVG